MSNAERVELLTVDRFDPANYRRFAARYQWWIHQVVFQRGTERVTVLWNGAAGAARILVPRRGESALLVDKVGAETPLEPLAASAGLPGGSWPVTLAGATRRFTLFGGDPPGYHYIGGSPLLVVERNVPADAPITRVVVG
jgi:hypothetical protein